MTTLFVRHQVEDYAKWRQVYDSVESMRKQGGVTAAAVYQADGDANDVTVTHDCGSIAAAKALAESADLRDAMVRAGVTSAPTMWFANKD